MADPSITLTAIQSPIFNLGRSVRNYLENSARCKLWSGFVAGGMLTIAVVKAESPAFPWAAGVMVLLALADAGQVAMAQVFTDAYNRFMRKLPLNGGNAMKAEEFFLPAPVIGWRQAGQLLSALGSFSVWPFYGALLALLVAFHVQTAPPGTEAKKATTVKAAQPGSRGTQPMSPIPQPTNRTLQFPNPAMRPMTPGTEPGQALPYSPIKGLPQQPAVRIPGAGGKPAPQPPAQPPKAPDAPPPEGKPGTP